MTSNVFFIGDTHFGHKNVIVFEDTKPFRPFATIEEHDEALVKNWNAKVSTHDVVYHLGDFCLGKNLHIAGRLNGLKRLVMGNHDYFSPLEYLKYFASMSGALQFEKMILTHIPVHPQQKERFRANIHGHLHTHLVQHVSYHPTPDPWYKNVSCEQIGLTPIAYEELFPPG